MRPARGQKVNVTWVSFIGRIFVLLFIQFDSIFTERTYRKAPQKPPSSVHVYGINPSTVRVVWRYVGVTLEEEPIQGYKVRVWETDQDMSKANDTIINIGNKLESYVSNLTPGKSYKMRVLAFSNGGDGRMSSPTLNFQMGMMIHLF